MLGLRHPCGHTEAEGSSRDGPRDKGVLQLIVDVMSATPHRVPLSKLKARLASAGHDPREAAMKGKLR